MDKMIRSINISIGITVILIIVACSPAKNKEKCTIGQGDFQASFTETGELQAVVAKHIVMPFLGRRYGYRNKLTGVLEHGTEVEEGDSVIALDPSNVMKFLVERENRLELEKAKFNKTLVQHSTKANQLKSQLEQQEASFNMAKLALDKSRFESERNKYIRQLEFQKAEINLSKTRKSIESNNKISRLDRIIQATKVKQLENDTADSHAALKKLVLRSPNKGLLQIQYNRSTRQLYKAGDESYPNRQLASIPDLRRMKVISSINEIDIDKVKTGQSVKVTLDAFPDLQFNGEVSMIGRLSHKKDYESSIKIFDIEVLVEENDNEVLKPGMTVSCEIVFAELQDVFYVSNDCIMRENGQYFLHLSNRGNITKTAVEIGPQNNSETVIYGDFREGQEVIPKQGVDRTNIQ